MHEDSQDTEDRAFKELNKEMALAALKYGGTLSTAGALGGGLLGFAGSGSLTAAFMSAAACGLVPAVATGIGYGLQYLAIKPSRSDQDKTAPAFHLK